jgi:sporulation protein YlmC with PRC-barrel domain
VLDEGNGAVGTLCIYEGSSPEAIHEHASRADLPVDEIVAIADTVVVRPDPEPANA